MIGKFIAKAEGLLREIQKWGVFIESPDGSLRWNDLVTSLYFTHERDVKRWLQENRQRGREEFERTSVPSTPSRQRMSETLGTPYISSPSPIFLSYGFNVTLSRSRPMSGLNFATPLFTPSRHISIAKTPKTLRTGDAAHEADYQSFLRSEKALKEDMESLNSAFGSFPSSPTTTRHKIRRERDQSTPLSPMTPLERRQIFRNDSSPVKAPAALSQRHIGPTTAQGWVDKEAMFKHMF